MDNQSPKLSLKDTVYQQLIELICQGKLLPDTLFTENHMISYFGVSKSPVREALIQLCHENVLKSIPRCGYQVTAISSKNVRDGIPRCGYQVTAISSKNVRDVTELRLYLELSSLPKVMENITTADIEELKRQNQVRLVNPEKKDLWIAWRNNYQFHMTVVRLAGNEQVNNAMEQAMTTYRRAYAQLYTLKKDVIAANKASYHDFFVSSLERHDVFSAHEYLKKDILFMEDELLGTGITT